jgi:hypothetical protein
VLVDIEDVGGSGNDDIIKGDAETSRANSAFGVLVAFQNGGNGITLSPGSTDNDQLTSIENIIGSNFAHQIGGWSVANALDGGNGNDLVGGAGIDTASYAGSATDVTVNPGTLGFVKPPTASFRFRPSREVVQASSCIAASEVNFGPPGRVSSTFAQFARGFSAIRRYGLRPRRYFVFCVWNQSPSYAFEPWFGLILLTPERPAQGSHLLHSRHRFDS